MRFCQETEDFFLCNIKSFDGPINLLFRSEDANKAFSQAVQMHDSLVMAWALWGDYLDGLFVLER